MEQHTACDQPWSDCSTAEGEEDKEEQKEGEEEEANEEEE
jgi:hypothetical protein